MHLLEVGRDLPKVSYVLYGAAIVAACDCPSHCDFAVVNVKLSSVTQGKVREPVHCLYLRVYKTSTQKHRVNETLTCD